jgi:hypothetical protein
MRHGTAFFRMKTDWDFFVNTLNKHLGKAEGLPTDSSSD